MISPAFPACRATSAAAHAIFPAIGPAWAAVQATFPAGKAGSTTGKTGSTQGKTGSPSRKQALLAGLVAAAACVAGPAASSAAAQVVLNTWTLVDPFNRWSISNPTPVSCRMDETAASATVGPGWVVSPFDVPADATVEVSVRALANGDDDLIGIAFSYQAASQHVLMHWKQNSQAFNWGDTTVVNDDVAEAGLKVLRINGSFTRDGLWGGTDGAGVSTLVGPVGTGWVDNTTYCFRFTLTPGRVVITRDGTQIFDVSDPAITGGRIAFFSFSQDDVIFSDVVITGCDDIDFNNNGVFPEDQDVIDFFDVLAGADCPACNDIDFNNNGVFPEDQDVIDFFNVLAGGSCP